MQLIARPQRKRRNIIILLIFLLLVVLEITLYYYIQVYRNKIDSIENISLEVKQNSSFELPKTIEVRLKSSKYEKKPVEWDKEHIDNKDIGNFKLEGHVEGYDEAVKLTVTVYEYIKSIEKPKELALKTDKKTLETENFILPKEISVVYSSDKRGQEKVNWDVDKIDTSKVGTYEIEGRLTRDIKCEPKVVCTLEVIDKNEAIKRIVVDNKFLEKSEVKETLVSMEELPNKVLETLLQGNMTIRYVEEDITDIPDFKSLQRLEKNKMKVFGVFKYPQIVIDCQAKYYVKFSDIDNFTSITLHEIGHSYDFLFNGAEDNNNFDLSSKDDFHDIWQNEADKLFRPEVTKMSSDLNNYYITYEYEYFAECFAFYFLSDKSKAILMEKAPRTYNFIDKCVNIN